MKLSLLRFVVLMISTILLTACGGGTGDSTSNASGEASTIGPSTTVGVAGSIMFVSATPENITLKGSAKPGGSETAILEFLVTDKESNPKQGQVCGCWTVVGSE